MNSSEELEKIVRTELDAIKTIYKGVDSRATKTLEEAKGANKDIHDKTSQLLAKIEKSNRNLKVLIATAISIIGIALGFAGLKTYNDIKKKSAEISGIYAKVVDKYNDAAMTLSKLEIVAEEANERLKDITKTATQTESLRQLALEIRSVSQQMKLDGSRTNNSNRELLKLSINYRFAKDTLFKGFIKFHSNKEPEVVLEAIETYLKLLEEAGIKMEPEEIQRTRESFVYFFRKCENDDWRNQVNARMVFVDWIEGLKPWDQTDTVKDLESLLSLGNERDVLKWNISIILAEMGARNENAIKILGNSTSSSNIIWVRIASAVGLIKMKENYGWEYLSKCFKEKGRDAFIAAFFLAQIPEEKLKSLGIKNLNLFDESEPYNAIIKILELQSYRNDNYFKSYIRSILNNE